MIIKSDKHAKDLAGKAKVICPHGIDEKKKVSFVFKGVSGDREFSDWYCPVCEKKRNDK